MAGLETKIANGSTESFGETESQTQKRSLERPVLPRSPFCIQFKGFVADGNFAYVQFISQKTLASVIDKIKADVKNKVSTPLAMLAMSPGMIVVGKVDSEAVEDVKYIRAQIYSMKGNTIAVMDMDELKEYELPIGNVYNISEEGLSVPFRAAKVELEHLELFSGTKYAQEALNASPGLAKRTNYCGTVIGKISKNPFISMRLRLCTPLKKNLGAMLVKNMWTVCRVPEVKEGECLEVVITHYTDIGEIHYQAVTLNAKLIDIINGFDNVIKYELIIVKNRDPNYSSIDMVKERFENQDEIFAAPYSQDNKYYRAKVLKVLDENNVHVQFIDYGNDEEMPISKLVILDAFDRATRYIAPQSRMIQLRINFEVASTLMDSILDQYEKFRLANITHKEDGLTYGDILVEAQHGRWTSIVGLLELR